MKSKIAHDLVDGWRKDIEASGGQYISSEIATEGKNAAVEMIFRMEEVDHLTLIYVLAAGMGHPTLSITALEESGNDDG